MKRWAILLGMLMLSVMLLTGCTQAKDVTTQPTGTPGAETTEMV